MCLCFHCQAFLGTQPTLKNTVPVSPTGRGQQGQAHILQKQLGSKKHVQFLLVRRYFFFLETQAF